MDTQTDYLEQQIQGVMLGDGNQLQALHKLVYSLVKFRELTATDQIMRKEDEYHFADQLQVPLWQKLNYLLAFCSWLNE